MHITINDSVLAVVDLPKTEQQSEIIDGIINTILQFNYREHQYVHGEFVRHSESGEHLYIYGGFIRDQLAGLPFHDIDIRFHNHSSVNSFIRALRKRFEVKIVKSSYIGCVSTEVKDGHNNCLKLDLSYDNNFRQIVFDFDVNMLHASFIGNEQESIKTQLNLMNPKCNMYDVLQNIHHKQFVILNSAGEPSLSHEFVSMTFDTEKNEEVLGSVIDRINCRCIDRYTLQGRKVIERRAKMEDRGWICLNSDCRNPRCVLAPDDLVAKYDAYIEKLKQIQKEKEAEKQKERDYINLLHMMSFMPGFIATKTGNRISHDRSVVAHTKSKEKKMKVKTKAKKSNKSQQKGRESCAKRAILFIQFDE